VELDFDSVNTALRDASALEVVQWALGLGRKTIATTSMGRNAAVMLHLVAAVDSALPTIWVDTGYNLRDTYIVAERLIRDLRDREGYTHLNFMTCIDYIEDGIFTLVYMLPSSM